MITHKYEDLPPLVKNIRAHLVLLYDAKRYNVGSGILVKIGGYIFILTAAHCLFENLKINLGLPWQSTSLSILNRWTDEELDIGFIEIKPFEVELLKKDEANSFEIGKKKETKIHLHEGNIAICGYPSSSHYKDGNAIGIIPLFFRCMLVTPEKWPRDLFESGKNPQLHVAIAYGRKHGGTFFDSDRNPVDFIEPNGLSGCGIWYYTKIDTRVETISYALIAIQTSYFRKSQVLVATKIEPLIDQICQRYNLTISSI